MHIGSCKYRYEKFKLQVALTSFDCKSHQPRAPQLPLHLANPPLPHHPKCLQFLPRPRKILHRIISLNPYQQRPRRIQNIHTLSRTRHNVPIRSNLQAIGGLVLSKIDGPLVSDISGVRTERVGVDDTFAGGVVGSAVGAGRGDVAADGTGVGYVDGFVVSGEGDAVGLDERIFDEVDCACRGPEAVSGSFELGRCVG